MKRLSVSLVVMLTLVSQAYAVSPVWVRQLGTDVGDYSYGVSADGLGSIYISGYTFGSLGGPIAGTTDAFVSKYDAAGNPQWTRQLGTSTDDVSQAVSADGLGNVYISGTTNGSLGGPHVGGDDAFVSKYDAAGNPQWSRQLGTTSSDEGHGVSADRLGNVYVAGFTRGSLGGTSAGDIDAFVSKYDAAGNPQWTRQLGTSSTDYGQAVSADVLGNVYIAGYTSGSLGGPNAGGLDAYVSKYDANGNFKWTKQLGTAVDERCQAVSADGLGNVYISGDTVGSLGGPNAGSADAFVAKYDATGNFQWTKQLGTSGADYSYSVSADGLGNVYISGETDGSLGDPLAGPTDSFVSKYDAAGNFQWTRQLGTTEAEASYGVSADGLGNVYTSGLTNGSLGGSNAGSYDAFVAKYSDTTVPEPSSVVLVLAALLGICTVGRSKRQLRG